MRSSLSFIDAQPEQPSWSWMVYQLKRQSLDVLDAAGAELLQQASWIDTSALSSSAEAASTSTSTSSPEAVNDQLKPAGRVMVSNLEAETASEAAEQLEYQLWQEYLAARDDSDAAEL